MENLSTMAMMMVLFRMVVNDEVDDRGIEVWKEV